MIITFLFLKDQAHIFFHCQNKWELRKKERKESKQKDRKWDFWREWDDAGARFNPLDINFLRWKWLFCSFQTKGSGGRKEGERTKALIFFSYTNAREFRPSRIEARERTLKPEIICVYWIHNNNTMEQHGTAVKEYKKNNQMRRIRNC